jgi:hypothetical protein
MGASSSSSRVGGVSCDDALNRHELPEVRCKSGLIRVDDGGSMLVALVFRAKAFGTF